VKVYFYLIAAGVIASALAASHFTAYRKGKHDVRVEWTASVAAANQEALRLERARQSRVDDVARIAAARAARILADAAGARRESDGLRSDLDATRQWAAQSQAAADQALGVTTGLLGRCTALYLGVAEDAARADAEARELRQGWPE
jgi:hypothetical protein